MNTKLLQLKIILFIFGLSLFLISTAQAQQATVSGTVTDSQSGDPLPAVNIKVKSSTVGTTTDANGNYELSVPSLQDTLTFSFIGYGTRQIPINNRNEINLKLRPQTFKGEEMVVVGYGTQQKTDVTGAISSVSGEEVDNITTSDASSLLQGKVSGVRVVNNSGQPGENSTVVIRGTGTFGNDQPLYVIDGNFSNSMSYLNPDDIESIEVLKDASAAAIYGNRAANGVIVVTTKKGQSGPTKINFSSNVGIQRPSRTLDFLNARQFADFINTANENDGTPKAPANTTEFDPSIDTDWQDLQLRSTAIQKYNMSVSGGDDNSTYYISGQYLKQPGVVVDEQYQRYNIRANSTFNLGIVDIRQSFSASRSVNNPNNQYGTEYGAIPTMPVYNEENDGGFAGVIPSYHGVARGVNRYGLALLNDNEFTTDQITGSINGTLEILKGLEYKINLGLDYSVFNSYNFTPTFFFSNSQGGFNQTADLNKGTSRSLQTLIENTLNYKTSLGKHNVNLLAGFTQQINDSDNIGTQATNFPNNNLRVIDAANEIVTSNGGIQKYSLISLLGRINYNYDDRYLLEGTFRYDGSSRFTEQNRWGAFPSISAGWRLSNESFFPEGTVSNLKIRASYGKLGNQNIGNYATISGLNIYTAGSFAGGTQPGVSLVNLANPNLIWETSKTGDIGVDIGLWQDKLTFTTDYYDKRTEGILATIPIPSYGGVGGINFSNILTNAASVKNTGFEFSGTYNYQPRGNDFQFSLTANLSTENNEVTSLGEGVNPIVSGRFTQQTLDATRTAVGLPIGSFYGYNIEGIYQNQEQIDADGRTGNVQPGDINFEDLNGDGEINSADRTNLGSYIPDFSYGLNWTGSYKNFNLQLFLQGVYGNEIWNVKKFQYIFQTTGGNKITDVLDSWTPQNRGTGIPRATIQDPANNKRPSSFYVEDGSYLRVKSLQIGYEFPVSFIEQFSLQNARVYLRGENLLTFTKYSGYDPEVGRGGIFGAGVDRTPQPHARTFSIGVDLSF